MKLRACWGFALAVLAAGVCLADWRGYGRVYELPVSGVLAVVNTQKNSVWRPCLLSVMCPDVAARTVTVFRVAGPVEYPLARQAASAQTYVYEFESNYWCGLSNGVKVVVSPACTGMVEVVYE